MKLRVVLVLAVSLAAGSRGPAGIDTGRYLIIMHSEGRKLGLLGVSDGRLVVGADFKRPDLIKDPAPDEWYIEGTRIKCGVGSWYLSYDPDDKTGRVFLERKPRKGVVWAFEPKPEHKRTSPEQREHPARVRAGSGVCKGWYLTAEERDEKPDGDRKQRKTWHLCLAPHPKVEAESLKHWVHN